MRPLGLFTSIDQKEMQGGNVLTASSPVKFFSSSHVTVQRSANLPSLKLFFKEKRRRKGECQQRKGLGGNTETGRHLLHDLLMLQTLPQIRLWFWFYFTCYAIQMASSFIQHSTYNIYHFIIDFLGFFFRLWSKSQTCALWFVLLQASNCGSTISRIFNAVK